jgi:hypothetical protein
MASAWGSSWGTNWGVSWGSGVVPPVPPAHVLGGGGSGGRWHSLYDDYDDEILADLRRAEAALEHPEPSLAETEIAEKAAESANVLALNIEFEAVARETAKLRYMVQYAEDQEDARLATELAEIQRRVALAELRIAIDEFKRETEDAEVIEMLLEAS